eukprot:CAMPEP_0184412126 /NCGR_PEP_ID=MMETSP0738-20130409/6215_1 /TAXON_ID=385413 /ORGANISM="Thalassiosira miniscula, Strain CCMP1093" /LENGTH=114 /DNA_ID=CAMNT_0026770525 /DNA_START=380 /DNA_END=722 /DNA_ORIENTATION=+
MTWPCMEESASCKEKQSVVPSCANARAQDGGTSGGAFEIEVHRGTNPSKSGMQHPETIDIAGVEIATVLVRTILRVVRRLKHGTRKVRQADLDVEQPGHGVADEDEHGAFSPGW